MIQVVVDGQVCCGLPGQVCCGPSGQVWGNMYALTNQGLDTTQVQHLHGFRISFFFVSCLFVKC